MRILLRNVIHSGTGTNAYWSKGPRWIGGKTGTSSDFRDAWFVGYIPGLVVGVWIGNDDNSSMNHQTGGRLPATIWREFMKLAQTEIKGSEWKEPPHQNFRICRISGKLATQHCPDVASYPYPLEESVLETCPKHPGDPALEEGSEPSPVFSEQLEDSFDTSL